MSHFYCRPPEEPRHDICSAHGCECDETFACQAKACAQEKLCIGCVWQCADCQEDRCEQHIVDVNASLDNAPSIYVCRPCRARRLATNPPARQLPSSGVEAA